MKDFVPLYTYLADNHTLLPFHIGGLVQPGQDKPFGINCQDALAVAAGRKFIAGVVCDGCAGTTNADYNSASFNEIGANILAMIVINAVRDKAGDADSPEELLSMIDRYTRKRLLNVIDPLRSYKNSSKSSIEYIACNMLSATIVSAVLTDKFFVIFSFGDGICGLNSEISDLDSFSGEYYSSTLFRQGSRKHCFNVFAQGPTEEITNIIIGTDGMMDFLDRPDNELVRFLDPSEKWPLVQGVYDTMEFTKEFRVRVSMPFRKRRNITSHDDRAVITIRRI